MKALRALVKEFAPIKSYRVKKQLYGEPCGPLTLPFWTIWDRLKYGALGKYITHSRRIQGWTRGAEPFELIHASMRLPRDAVIVEVGAFVGCSTVLLAGGRKLAGSGQVHSIDPFDGCGDDFSFPIYESIRKKSGLTLRERFEKHVERAGVSDYIVVHQNLAHEVARDWRQPIDMLFMDGDFSLDGAQITYASWIPFLKRGGILALHNSTDETKAHNGNTNLVKTFVQPPDFDSIRLRGSTTFAVKRSETVNTQAYREVDLLSRE